eukprot:scaffold703_cov245-Pinguiococcus_pyrenoidosus.AAC.4
MASMATSKRRVAVHALSRSSAISGSTAGTGGSRTRPLASEVAWISRRKRRCSAAGRAQKSWTIAGVAFKRAVRGDTLRVAREDLTAVTMALRDGTGRAASLWRTWELKDRNCAPGRRQRRRDIRRTCRAQKAREKGGRRRAKGSADTQAERKVEKI